MLNHPKRIKILRYVVEADESTNLLWLSGHHQLLNEKMSKSFWEYWNIWKIHIVSYSFWLKSTQRSHRLNPKDTQKTFHLRSRAPFTITYDKSCTVKVRKGKKSHKKQCARFPKTIWVVTIFYSIGPITDTHRIIRSFLAPTLVIALTVRTHLPTQENICLTMVILIKE